MAPGIHVTVSDGPVTRLGRLVLAGEVVDDEPRVPSSLRVHDAYVLSVVTGGHGSYRHADGRAQPIRPGAVTLVQPGVPHWYGTAPGERWSELFTVFGGRLFDTLTAVGVISEPGPRYPEPAPSAAALRTLLRATPRSQSVAEHQLLGLADWLLDAVRPADSSRLSAPIATAVDLLVEDLSRPVDVRVVAADVGLSYDAFRRRFTAEVGEPPLTFRNTRRLRAAANLLRLTSMTNRKIARSLGFTDEFHFSRRFRARFGVSPRGYRQLR